ncbi:regulatory protein RecX [Psychrobacter urativorans]|uniref:regulatory protein RecX n=1 Tax=Psychrobacter urativorans TaxID=45610 RepID=UPI00191A6F9B|nr:regulatory protein RecX [Psychrobacter urativorans]
MKIKTLAEILAESESDSASLAKSKRKSSKQKQPSKAISNAHKLPAESKIEYLNSKQYRSSDAADINDSTTFDSNTPSSSKSFKTKSKKRKKRFHPASNFTIEPNAAPNYQLPEPQSIKEMLAEVKHEVHDKNINESATHTSIKIDTNSESVKGTKEVDNLPSALKAYLRTPEQRQAETDAIKAESRLRWLAFYYLSRREYGKAELKQKLLDKEQDVHKIDALLEEFESKGYQSDYRTTLMLIRESIRKGRGRGRIKQEFYHKKIAMPSNIDELIDMANSESDEFIEFIDDSADSMVEGVDWLKLAVTARIKKYGDDVPIEQKDKARQLRFLQYRGFNSDICFQALKYTLNTLDERF